MVKARILATALFLLVPAAPAVAEQTPSAERTITQARRPPRKLTLYDRLGGITAIQLVVRDLVKAAAVDPRIKAYFTATAADPKRLTAFRERMTDQICEITGGPCAYTGRSMKEAHAGLHIASTHFEALLEDLAQVLDSHDIGAAEKKELLSLLEPLRKDIVERRGPNL